jgi:hypothetical protein
MRVYFDADTGCRMSAICGPRDALPTLHRFNSQTLLVIATNRAGMSDRQSRCRTLWARVVTSRGEAGDGGAIKQLRCARAQRTSSGPGSYVLRRGGDALKVRDIEWFPSSSRVRRKDCRFWCLSMHNKRMECLTEVQKQSRAQTLANIHVHLEYQLLPNWSLSTL